MAGCSRQVVIAIFSIKTDVSEYGWILTGTNKHHMTGAKTSSDACKNARTHACMTQKEYKENQLKLFQN